MCLCPRLLGTFEEALKAIEDEIGQCHAGMSPIF